MCKDVKIIPLNHIRVQMPVWKEEMKGDRQLHVKEKPPKLSNPTPRLPGTELGRGAAPRHKHEVRYTWGLSQRRNTSQLPSYFPVS